MRLLILILAGLCLTTTVVASGETIYLRVQFVEDGHEFLSGSASGGCTIAPGEECNGMFYRSADGSGIIIGGNLSSVEETEFELHFSATVETTDQGQDLVVSSYLLSLAEDGAIIGGRKNVFRQPVAFGDEVTVPINNSFGDESLGLIFTVGTKSDPPWGEQSGPTYRVKLVSTNVGPTETSSRQSSHMRQLQPRLSFSSDFTDIENDDSSRKCLRYNSQVYLEGWDENKPASEVKLHYKRQYLIDSTHASDNQQYSVSAKFQSVNERVIQLSPDKMIKLVFPPDQPSVHGFDIEDTLMIYVDESSLKYSE